MKKTININLSGYPFIIDEDAYEMLKDYLDTIRYAFETKDDTGELATDIESRIAELLIENEHGTRRIVSLNEISSVIERIGKPSDFIEIDEEFDKKDSKEEEEKIEIKEEKVVPPPYNSGAGSTNSFTKKRLFRDPQNSMLGGVCSGLAAYFNIDVTVVRLISVLLFFLSATTVAIIYIVLWIVVPAANTPLQRMQMKGENPTMENIGKTVTENYQNDERQPQQNSPVNNGFINTLFSIFVKCLIILGVIIIIPLLIVLGATLVGCMIAVFVIGIGIFSGGMFDSVTEGLMVLFILLAVIGGTITLGVPLWLLIKKIFKKNEGNLSSTTQRSVLIIWLIGIALVSVFTVKAVKTGMKLDRENWGFTKENIKILDNMDESEIEGIKIKKGKINVKTKDGKTIEIYKGEIKVQEPEITIDEAVTDSTLTVVTPVDSIK